MLKPAALCRGVHPGALNQASWDGTTAGWHGHLPQKEELRLGTNGGHHSGLDKCPPEPAVPTALGESPTVLRTKAFWGNLAQFWTRDTTYALPLLPETFRPLPLPHQHHQHACHPAGLSQLCISRDDKLVRCAQHKDGPGP